MHKSNKIRASKLSVDPRLFVRRRGESEDSHNKRIWAELRKFNAFNAPELIFEVAKNDKLPSKFLPVYCESREHYDVISVPSEFTSGNFLAWTLGCFSAKADLLKEFTTQREYVNSEILKGNSVNALARLESFSKVCKSWWAVSLEIHIAKELELRDTRQLIHDLPHRFKLGNIAPRVVDLQLMSESSSIFIFVRDLLARMNEYRSSGLQAAIDSGAIESCRYLPINYDSSRVVKLGKLQEDWFESIIDQYVLFKEVICELVVSGQLPSGVREATVDIAAKIGDKELLAIVGLEDETAPEVTSVLALYTKGSYKEAILQIQNLQNSNRVEIFGLIEVYAKAKIYAGCVTGGVTFFDSLANELAAILQCDKKSSEKIDYLNRICVKFRHEPWAKSLNFHMLSALEEVETDQEVELARLHTVSLGSLNTPKAKTQNYRFPVAHSEAVDIPLHRQVKYADFDGGSLDVEKGMFPVLSDFLKLKSRTLILKEQFIGAIKFAVGEYIDNSVSCLHLPIRALCGIASDVKKLDRETYILCLIAYDIYNREYSGIFEEDKSELFDELMKFNGSHRPSQVFQADSFTKIEAYFLKHLCIPSQLDNLINYTSDDDVVHERVAILDLLIDAKVEGFEQLRSEKDNVLETMFSEKLRAKIESGKLFVDVQALKSQRKHVYQALFEQAKTIQGGIYLEPLPLDNNTGSSNDIFEIVEGSALASNRKTQLLYQIFNTAVHDFALNENYGLDKYLSAEIRHIVFVTQLRSCFEKTHLVTSLKDGAYLSNIYWINKYSFVHNNIVLQIDELLKGFSERVDSILSEVNEYFRVELFDRNSKNIFDFLAYHFRLVELSEIIARANTADEFFNQLLEYMWELASASAKSAQQIINDGLAVEVLGALAELEAEVYHAKGDVAVVELMQEIKNARSMFTQEIELVLNWFRFVGADDSKNLERLGVVIDATMSSFDSIYGHKYKKPIFSACKSELCLNYREARALFISLFTALENACKYGLQSESVIVSHEVGVELSFIKISNLVPSFPGVTAQELILREKAKWSPEYSNLSREEGGSGLYKIYNTLSSSSLGFTFDIEADQGSFTATMGLVHENFDHRRQLVKARENS